MNINEIKLECSHSVQEMEIILAGLKKLPLELSMELYAKLHGSASAQVAAHTQAEPKNDQP